MSQHAPEKGIALYSPEEANLWERAERKARQELGYNAREGQVLAQICERYLEDSISTCGETA